MRLERGICEECKSVKPIVNRKRGLCNDCNRVRLNGGEVPVKRGGLKKVWKGPIKGLTKKEKIQKQVLAVVKSQIIIRDEGTCQGCRMNSGVCDRSHILSVKQHKKLELDPSNIQLLCRSCHMKWESWDPLLMLSLECFEENVKYIETHSTSTFWRIMYKLKECLISEKTSTRVVDKITGMYFYNLIVNL